jgi:Tfp pilus assembly protein PilO
VKGRKLPRKAAIGLIVGGDLLLLLVGWFFLISPQRSTAASIAQATAAAEVQLAEAKKPIVHVKPAAVQQPEIKTADLYSLAKAMPSTLDMPNLLLELDQVARSAGVTLATISPGTATPSLTGASFSTVAITLSFSGDFYSLTDMLYRLRSLVSVRNGALQTSGRLFSVGSVGLVHGGSGPGLNASVVLNTYVYGGAAVAPAAPATPASTDTTPTTTATTTTTAAPAADVAPGP